MLLHSKDMYDKVSCDLHVTDVTFDLELTDHKMG